MRAVLPLRQSFTKQQSVASGWRPIGGQAASAQLTLLEVVAERASNPPGHLHGGSTLRSMRFVRGRCLKFYHKCNKNEHRPAMAQVSRRMQLASLVRPRSAANQHINDRCGAARQALRDFCISGCAAQPGGSYSHRTGSRSQKACYLKRGACAGHRGVL